MTRPLAPGALPDPADLPVRPDLPDLFETFDGDRIETAEDWEQRRAEIVQLFRHYVYGYAPDPPAIDVSVERTEGVLDGAATLVEATIDVADLPADAPAITMAVYLPAEATGANVTGTDGRLREAVGALPTVLATNGTGNQPTGPPFAVTSDIEHVLDRGYAFATYFGGDIVPDDEDSDDGLYPYYSEDDLPGPPGADWGAVAAWAWGLERCVDVLEGIDAVDDDRIVVTGHSRRGKAALLAGATDERIALVAPHQSGTGGMALARDNDQETIEAITGGFPHWFAGNFRAFAGDPERLPVDQHCLVACVAPRPLVDTEGARDYWTNPDRALDSLRAAAPVWDFLGAEGLVGDGLHPERDPITAETVGNLVQVRRGADGPIQSRRLDAVLDALGLLRLRRGAVHTFDRGYWDAILDVADLHLE